MFLVPARACMRRSLRAAASLCLVMVANAPAASGQTPLPCERAVLTLGEAADLLRVDSREVERLAEHGQIPARRVGSPWRFNCATVLAWLNGDWKPSAAATAPRDADRLAVTAPDARSPLAARDLEGVTAAGMAPSQRETSPAAGAQHRPTDRQSTPIGEAPEEREAEDVFLRGQRVLLGRGEAVVDFGQFYSRTGDQVLASPEGAVGLATVEQEVLTTLLVGRVGVFEDTELFASATFHIQDVRHFLGNNTLASSGDSGFGATHVGLRRTLLRERVGRPEVVITFNGRIPTGDTTYGAGGGLVLVKSVDPVVLFVNANYLRALGRDASASARLQPKSSGDVSIGYGLALNDTLAMSLALSGVFTGTRTLSGSRVRQPGRFSVRFGLTSWLARGLYIEPSVSFGVAGPGDSFAFGVSMPYAF